MDSSKAVHNPREIGFVTAKVAQKGNQMSYIIANGNIVAKINAELASGTEVTFSRQRCEEAINASREWNLVNANRGKIGNGAAWDRKWQRMCVEQCDFATEINPGEFFVG